MGLIFSLYSVAYVITAIVGGIYLARIGRRKMLLMGIIGCCISMLGFGILEWVEDVQVYVGLSFFFRFIGGVGSASLNVASYAMVALEYPE